MKILLGSLLGVLLLTASAEAMVISVDKKTGNYIVDINGAGVDVQSPKSNETPSVTSRISNYGLTQATKGNIRSPKQKKTSKKMNKSKK